LSIENPITFPIDKWLEVRHTIKMKYTPLNGFLLVEKKEMEGLIIAGQDKDPQSTIHGIVVEETKYDPTCANDDCEMCGAEPKLKGKEIVFVRGQAREIKLENKKYFMIAEDKVLLYVN
jgi:co-chaperonin GroES (HSP10)